MQLQLSKSEWNAIFDCCNGCLNLWDETGMSADMIRAEVEDADKLDGLGDKWEIDIPALCEKITDENTEQICQAIRKFWGGVTP